MELPGSFSGMVISPRPHRGPLASPRIGYENAAKTAQYAHRQSVSLREACVSLGFLTPEEFDELFHPNDHVNMSQSSNDTFPTAMHIAAVCAIRQNLLPAIAQMISTMKGLEEANRGIVKSGRTHLQDATPIAFSQEISGWRAMLERDQEMIGLALGPLSHLALGGTAVGTGLNAHPEFAVRAAERISQLTGCPFQTSENKFQALSLIHI